ncbi:MAG: lysostaphin resistance A-like protein [Sciscionella sp.]
MSEFGPPHPPLGGPTPLPSRSRRIVDWWRSLASGGEREPEHRWGLGAFLLVLAVFLLSAVFLAAILQPTPKVKVGVPAELIATVVPGVLAAAVALLITKLRGNGPSVDLRWQIHKADLRVGLKLGLAGLALTIVTVEIWTGIVGSQDATSAIGALADGSRLSLPAVLVMFCYTWLLGPICEEIIFRGVCWGAIEGQGWGRWAAFLLSTSIFAVSHLEPLRTVVLLIISVPIGLGRLLTGRIGSSIIAHQVNNFLPALTMLLISLGVMSP